MQIKHEHPVVSDQEQYEQQLRRAFAACIRKLKQTAGDVPACEVYNHQG